jgi:DNA-binding MarR family transcriptional regulator
MNSGPAKAGRPIEHAQRALRLIPRLNRWAATSVRASRLGKGLSLRQLGALFGIRDGVVSPGELALRMRVTPAVVTGLIERLVRQGHVRRATDPEDRRRLHLELTETGLSISRSVELGLAESLASELVVAGAPELAELDRALDLLERALGALEARPPAPTPTPRASSKQHPNRGKPKENT